MIITLEARESVFELGTEYSYMIPPFSSRFLSSISISILVAVALTDCNCIPLVFSFLPSILVSNNCNLFNADDNDIDDGDDNDDDDNDDGNRNDDDDGNRKDDDDEINEDSMDNGNMLSTGPVIEIPLDPVPTPVPIPVLGPVPTPVPVLDPVPDSIPNLTPIPVPDSNPFLKSDKGGEGEEEEDEDNEEGKVDEERVR